MAKKCASSYATRGVGQDVVTRLLNVLEALVPNQGGLPAAQATSKAQAQDQLNVAASQTPELAPQQVVQPTTTIGQSKEFMNFMDLKPPEFDASSTSIEPQKFIDRCENILTTLRLKKICGVEFATFLFTGSVESWWILIQRDVGDKSSFNCGLSWPAQSESMVQSSRSDYPARQVQQQMQRKGNSSY
ncbi:hypothetical protein K7X08_020213 [Anisodus acutangulus]|uniref:Uncharacterized protein n=1 Tax=Anisodus acutangulus TaxID=402998 RepID=A0A9Q1MAZ6_9SOLA|nr:hypothetical protein K7X08_020213 [Anisodus acutangulus]